MSELRGSSEVGTLARMGLFSRKKKDPPQPKPQPIEDGEWVYVLGTRQHRTAVGRREREAVAEARLLARTKVPEVSIYIDGRKVGSLNEKMSARFATVILEREPELRRITVKARIVNNDPGFPLGVDVLFPE